MGDSSVREAVMKLFEMLDSRSMALLDYMHDIKKQDSEYSTKDFEKYTRLRTIFVKEKAYMEIFFGLYGEQL